MVNLEKFIKGLKVCSNRLPGEYTCYECPYEVDGNECETNLAQDALTFLKEQKQETELCDRCGLVRLKEEQNMDEIERIEEERLVESMITLWIQPDAPEWIIDYVRQELRKQRGLLKEKETT